METILNNPSANYISICYKLYCETSKKLQVIALIISGNS